MPSGVYPREPVEQRFWRYVDKTSTCWLWTASLSGGRGQFTINRKHFRAHVYAYTLVNGPVPAGLELDHLCRTPSCVRPDHLEAVTHRVNMLRGETVAARNASVTHCPQGHPYDEANTRHRRGMRHCRACDRIRHTVAYKTAAKAGN